MYPSDTCLVLRNPKRCHLDIGIHGGILFIVVISMTLSCNSALICHGTTGATGVTSINKPSDGIMSCYSQSIEKVTFEEAVTFCERNVEGRMIFIETTTEQTEIQVKPFARNAFWLGLTPALGHWYWTYDLHGIGQRANYFDWEKLPDPMLRFVLDFTAPSSYKWIPVNSNQLHYAVCELDSYWHIRKSGFVTLSPQLPESIDITTPDIATETTQDLAKGSTETTTSIFHYSGCKSEGTSNVYMTKVDCALYNVVYLIKLRSLFTCLRYCMAKRGCCGLSFDTDSGHCFQLLPRNILLPATKSQCYFVRRYI